MTTAHVAGRARLAGALGFEPDEFYGDDAVQAVIDAVDEAKHLRAQLAQLRKWLETERAKGASVVRIAAVEVRIREVAA